MLSELYRAESKGQVYGHLHSYMCSNEKSTSTISTLLTIYINTSLILFVKLLNCSRDHLL